MLTRTVLGQHNTHGLSVGELLERAAADANLAMLRTHVEPSRFQISVIDWTTSLLNSELEYLPLDDSSKKKSDLRGATQAAIALVANSKGPRYIASVAYTFLTVAFRNVGLLLCSSL